MIYHNISIPVYKGAYLPVNVYHGLTKVGGWKNSTQTGASLEFTGTYDDVFSALSIAGVTSQTVTSRG